MYATDGQDVFRVTVDLNGEATLLESILQTDNRSLRLYAIANRLVVRDAIEGIWLVKRD